MELSPKLTSGSGTPVTGSRPAATSRLSDAWPADVQPGARRQQRAGTARGGGDAEGAADEQHEGDDQDRHADEPEALADRDGHHVRVGLRHPHRAAGADAEHARALQRRARAVGLEPDAEDVGLAAQHVAEAEQAVAQVAELG
jgi:hypothetical protein